jgi:FkbM family methyltransferase
LNSEPDAKKYTKVLNSFYLDTSDESDNYVQKECRENKQWEPYVTKWMMENIKPGWVCLDIGANIGYYTEVLSRLSGPGGKVISFEPLKFLVERYKEAQKYNDYSNCSSIEMYNYALSNKEDVVDIYVSPVNIGGSNIVSNNKVRMFNDDYRVEKVKCAELKSLYSGHIDFMKIDIEGHESIAWEGFPETAKNCPLVLLELSNDHTKEFVEFIFNDYNVCDILDRDISMKEFYEVVENDQTVVHMDLVLRKRN